MQSPVIIPSGQGIMFGVIRAAGTERKIAVLVPAITGTRIGPQRLYVQLSEHFIRAGVATLCLDLPIHGDSFGLKKKQADDSAEAGWITYYAGNLEAVHSFLFENHGFEEIIPVSISFGCIPILAFASKMGYRKAILLSPNHRLSEVSGINTNNLRAYRLKLFSPSTWRKVFAMEVNYRKVFDNIFNLSAKKQQKRGAGNNGRQKHKPGHQYENVDVLCVFGEKDPGIEEHFAFWEQLQRQGRVRSLSLEKVKGSDHSFFGWQWKESLGETVHKWLS